MDTITTRSMAVLELVQEPDMIGRERFEAAVFRGREGVGEIQMSAERFIELGSPLEITIAIYPGDRQDLLELDTFPK